VYNSRTCYPEAQSPVNQAQRRIHDAAIRLFAEQGNHRVSVSDLAQAAGVARGTIYNNIETPEYLFEQVAAQLASEMHERVTACDQDSDPAHRLANDIRFFVRRAHEEPQWGWFVYRFGINNDSLRDLLNGTPMRAIVKGVDRHRYDLREDLLPGAMAMIAGTTLTAMWMVLEGHQTWREAGSGAAELVLRSFGIAAEEARRLAESDLPPLPPTTSPDLHVVS